jgi:hypothetical protein
VAGELRSVRSYARLKREKSALVWSWPGANSSPTRARTRDAALKRRRLHRFHRSTKRRPFTNPSVTASNGSRPADFFAMT